MKGPRPSMVLAAASPKVSRFSTVTQLRQVHRDEQCQREIHVGASAGPVCRAK